MTPAQLNSLILTSSLSLLEPRMDTPEARAMLIAIALQESGLRARRQVNGPARSLLQFERGGVQGVAHHKASAPHLAKLCDALCYTADIDVIHAAIEHNDLLAFGLGRLLLWTHPAPMPPQDEWMRGWELYAHDLWRPGRPRFETWERHWNTAWEAVAA